MNESSVQSETSSGVVSIPFSQLPGQSRLFLEYLADPQKLRRFYPNAVRSHNELIGHVPAVLESYDTPREQLCDILRVQQEAFGAGPKAFDNLGLLERPDAVAIVTGQQAGLFTGPLYTIYKALSAVRLAECLNEKGINAVPIFWAATEDHDFAEVSGVNGLDSFGSLFHLAINPSGSDDGRPVGKVLLDDSIQETIRLFGEHLPSTPYSRTVRELIATTYTPGSSYGTAFCGLVARLFEPFGLVVVDPLDERLKALCSPIYEQALQGARLINSNLRDRDRQLKEEGFHSQVLVTSEYVPMFYHTVDGARRALKLDSDGDFWVAGTKDKFTDGELVEIARRDPARLSPGVMLRPVVQDFLFPTLCYYGGGAEISYFAQNSVVYEAVERPVTPIMHRQSFTVIEARHRRTMAKFQLDLPQLFGDFNDLVSTIVARYVDRDAVEIFIDAERTLEREFDRLRSVMSKVDPTLEVSVEKRRRKATHHVAALRRKFERARLEKDAETYRRVHALTNSLVPEGQLQERSVNVFTFVAKYGPQFLSQLYESIDLDDKGHRLLNI